MDFTQTLHDLIDFRSFSNLWYWIALAVTWSAASHRVLGIPFDMVMRARRLGGKAEQDLQDIVRVNVTRILYIGREAGVILMAMFSFVLTTLGLLGFLYRVEFCQAIFLIALPMSLVGLLSLATAARIEEHDEQGEVLRRRLSMHRIMVQAIGIVSIFVTAFWGMLQNMNLSILPG
ncbi:component of SufBCD complex [Defluviimonas sp. WL0024]|uniref:Component of SufBCD complex n=2 Tax=Albidovulum TaxID=205889 RepID=A0ABT3J0C7_9RHOB|nr:MULTISPECIES: component of SufBCD complex [Defluviimonas]MCU9846866.1 component of SufBCD complex [Defluviimonas sp. WL0024]MCW3781125.1 component of SufBCD complex [Defluviimonas salinarum]